MASMDPIECHWCRCLIWMLSWMQFIEHEKQKMIKTLTCKNINTGEKIDEENKGIYEAQQKMRLIEFGLDCHIQGSREDIILLVLMIIHLVSMEGLTKYMQPNDGVGGSTNRYTL